ncbi:hypothetical protein FS749_004566 [Ceratobasidium sp. UAMH 11750]|nr:hypothetical protein FS749_004566 [Ceratobasidium sp. UAMH 11750]
MMEEALSEGSVTYRPNVSMYKQEPVAKRKEERARRVDGLALHELSVFTGQEEKFAYARATSRLVQMTSAKYAATAIWQPLAQVHQPWHQRIPPASPSDSLPADVPTTPTFAAQVGLSTKVASESDWAEEESYDKKRGGGERPEAPRLSENHAWGVRDDWGKGAGEWGKGVAGRRDKV